MSIITWILLISMVVILVANFLLIWLNYEKWTKWLGIIKFIAAATGSVLTIVLIIMLFTKVGFGLFLVVFFFIAVAGYELFKLRRIADKKQKSSTGQNKQKD